MDGLTDGRTDERSRDTDGIYHVIFLSLNVEEFGSVILSAFPTQKSFALRGYNNYITVTGVVVSSLLLHI